MFIFLCQQLGTPMLCANYHLVASMRKPAVYDAHTEKLLMTRNIHASAHTVGRSHTHASVRVCTEERLDTIT